MRWFGRFESLKWVIGLKWVMLQTLIMFSSVPTRVSAILRNILQKAGWGGGLWGVGVSHLHSSPYWSQTKHPLKITLYKNTHWIYSIPLLLLSSDPVLVLDTCIWAAILEDNLECHCSPPNSLVSFHARKEAEPVINWLIDYTSGLFCFYDVLPKQSLPKFGSSDHLLAF